MARNKQFSKVIIKDIRPLLWIVTISGLLLAFLCVILNYVGSLPWIATMVSAVWASYATISSFYLNMAKSDHKQGGITYESAKIKNFEEGQI